MANTSLLVLCGGAGLRMGGRDKPLLEWRGLPMVDHILASVPAQMPKIISANRHVPSYASRGLVITDAEVRGNAPAGPLVGILGGLTAARTTWLLVSPGDSPALSSDWWRRMFAASQQDSNVVAHDSVRQQHLHLLLHESVQDNLAEYLGTDQHAVHAWLETLNLVQARFHDPGAFANINQTEDFDA